MSYGHYATLFLDPAEAERYLDACRRDTNRTAENHHDRVAAQRCLMLAAGWSPVPLPAPTSSKSRAQARPTRRVSTATR